VTKHRYTVVFAHPVMHTVTVIADRLLIQGRTWTYMCDGQIILALRSGNVAYTKREAVEAQDD